MGTVRRRGKLRARRHHSTGLERDREDGSVASVSALLAR